MEPGSVGAPAPTQHSFAPEHRLRVWQGDREEKLHVSLLHSLATHPLKDRG